MWALTLWNSSKIFSSNFSRCPFVKIFPHQNFAPYGNSKTRPNEAIPNIDEHNKMNSVFFRICLVPCASSVLFDDGEVHCRVYDLWLS